MAPYVLIIMLVVVASLAVATRARAAQPSIQVQTSRTIVATWVCEDKIPRQRTHARSPWKRHSAGYRRAELNLWRNRWRACTYLLRERARQWHWEAWLPEKWQRIARCETNLDTHFANSQYVSMFGIARSSWAAFRPAGVPSVPEQASPWQQWQVALAIWRRYGFSGWGCRNA